MDRSSPLIQFPNHLDHRGELVFFEGNKEIPFEIKRVYYLYNTCNHFRRGVHAHKTLKQVLVAICGSFEVIVDDGNSKKHYLLSDPGQGLYIEPMLWRELKNFSPGAICLVLASDYYNDTDYVQDYNEFIRLSKISK